MVPLAEQAVRVTRQLGAQGQGQGQGRGRRQGQGKPLTVGPRVSAWCLCWRGPHQGRPCPPPPPPPTRTRQQLGDGAGTRQGRAPTAGARLLMARALGGVGPSTLGWGVRMQARLVSLGQGLGLGLARDQRLQVMVRAGSGGPSHPQ